MTTHPKREYTPEEIEGMAEFVSNCMFNADHSNHQWQMQNKCADMLRSLASQLAAQKRKPLPKPGLLIALRDEIDELSNAEPIISDVYDMNKWMDVLEEAAQQLRASQPPSPDQDREVSP